MQSTGANSNPDYQGDSDHRDNLKELNFEKIDQQSYVSTFKIYPNTTFDDIKKSACKFWRKRFEKFDDGDDDDADGLIITDEYFNNLSTFKDTIQNFYEEANGYQPLNPNCEACVFLIKKNAARCHLHFLQYESVELKDENNKENE